jgi:hypothetical protein
VAAKVLQGRNPLSLKGYQIYEGTVNHQMYVEYGSQAKMRDDNICQRFQLRKKRALPEPAALGVKPYSGV